MTQQMTFGVWLESVVPQDATTFPKRYLEASCFPIADEARKAAWELHVELRTRIATQELPLHSGQEGAALASLYQVFDRSRATLEKHGPKVGAVGIVVMAALNEDLRYFTGYWHNMLRAGALDQPDESGDFRAELRTVQEQLSLLADFLGYVALEAAYHPDRLIRAASIERPHMAPLPATTTVPPLTEQERREGASIERRRMLMLSPEAVALSDRAGLALSGGGIRSATFSLGVATALSRMGLYKHFDYLSTVSGGGYTGTLISTWATSVASSGSTKEQDASSLPPETRAALIKGPLCDDAAIEYLRDRSRYLVDGGVFGVARALLPIALGTIASAAMLVLTTMMTVPVAIIVGRLAQLAFASVPEGQGEAESSGIAMALALMLGVLALALVVRWTSSRSIVRKVVTFLVVVPALVAAPASAIVVVDKIQTGLDTLLAQLVSHLSAEVVLAAFPFLMTAVGHLLARKTSTFRSAGVVIALSPWVAYALGLTWLANIITVESAEPLLYRALDKDGGALYWAVALVLSTVMVIIADVNKLSPHGYYRDRLAETYCVKVKDGRVETIDSPPALQDLTDLAPIHLINATVNLPATRARNDRGRGAAPFLFSKHGWIYPKEVGGTLKPEFAPMEKRFRAEADTATAMAISGAAVSPWMGTSTPSGTSPWLTLFNLRLSCWLPNPAFPRAPGPWGFYLLRELTGVVNEKSARLNVSDGGHFENLGIYELLRRRCRYIVAIDGEADTELQCRGLMNLVRLARIDFDAEIKIDVRKLRLDPDRFSRAHLAIGRIRYRGNQDPEKDGYLMYIKLSVSGDEPSYVLDYRSREPMFPHHSTGDQVFSEEQFEAYRALGQHIGQRLFRPELIGDLLVGGKAEVQLSTWIEAIHGAMKREPPKPLV